MIKLVDSIKRNVALYDNKEAIIQGEQHLSYRELDALVNRLAYKLQQIGVSAGDRVCILLDNDSYFILAYLAILEIGGIVVPLNPSMTLDALACMIDDCFPKVLFLENRLSNWVTDLFTLGFNEIGNVRQSTEPFIIVVATRPRISAFPNPYFLDLAVIMYTSGTTGRPKGVMLTDTNMAAIAKIGKDFLQLSAQDRIGIVTPLFHLYGLREIDGCLRTGGTLVLVKNLTYPAQVLKQFHDERVTGFSGVPGSLALFMSRYESLLKACQEHLRYITLGTAPAPPYLLSGLKSALPATRIIVTYGLTEASRVCFREVTDPDLKVGSVGQPYPGVTLLILNEEGQFIEVGAQGHTPQQGRVAVKSAMVMKGYWNRPDLTMQVLRSDGTLLTSDYGHLDSENYLFLLGRIDELINSGGEKISPDEVEMVLLGHPAIAEVAVTKIPDPEGILGEVVKAYIVRNPGFQTDSDELMRYCNRHLESFKVPKIIEFSESLPRTALGKAQKSLLK
jgi:acyl-CoA synthetase (AMP-forming)/AMP-acid ligase II